jgi:hypothetical protein
MMNAGIAVVLFAGVLGAIGLFYSKLGKLSFWKLAAKLPKQALEFISADPAWVIVAGSQPAPGKEFVGPFLLPVPTLGRTVKLYAREDQIESSQQRFIERYRDLVPRHGFPILSVVALLYPVGAMLSMASTPASPMLILGYGFANLGYLLGAAFVFPGHFRVLGLGDRLPTVAIGVCSWVIGFASSNIVAA